MKHKKCLVMSLLGQMSNLFLIYFLQKIIFFLIKGLALRNCINTLRLFDDSFFLYQAIVP